MNAGGDSKGMVEFIKSQLPDFARSRPYVEFNVQQRFGAPAELIAYYMNGSIKRHVCYHLSSKQVYQQIKYLCDTSAVGEAKNYDDKQSSDELVVKEEKEEWIRRRKNPRGSKKEIIVDIRTTGSAEWKNSYWKSIKQINWKLVGRPTDRKFPLPVIRSGISTEPAWDPFHSKNTFRP